MSQLLTLIWLKWKLLKNSLRSSKAVINQAATVIGMLLALGLALLIALGLGIASYVLSRPGANTEIFRQSGAINENSSVEFIFFSILAFLYLMWATLPLSIGTNKQFDAGRLLIYPISLRKLFAVDFISELTTLQSVFALPAILAMAIGAGLATGNLTLTLIGVIPVTVFGVSLSKWLTTTIGSLVRRKRTRGETIIALIGAVAGLGGALVGQLAPIIVRHAESFRSLRWSPPGAAALLIMADANHLSDYLFSYVTLSLYTIALIIATYWIARRTVLGLGGARKQKVARKSQRDATSYSGWELPFFSPELSAIIEKELRYAMRNAQLRMMALMPLILIVIRLVNSNRLSNGMKPGSTPAGTAFLSYGAGLLATGGVLYVFLVLAGISCNLFAFEEGGMRTLILSPIERRKILLGKNLTVTIMALAFSVVLLAINAVVFRDLTPLVLLFVTLSFISFAAIIAMLGNWFSIRFPKRMQFGKRLNLSGVAGLLLIPMIVVLALPPLGATLAGYFTRSLAIEYATLAATVACLVGLYLLVIRVQGRSLEMREIEILEVVKEPNDT